MNNVLDELKIAELEAERIVADAEKQKVKIIADARINAAKFVKDKEEELSAKKGQALSRQKEKLSAAREKVLDEGAEKHLYQLLRDACPQSTLVSVGHRDTLTAFHERVWEFRLSEGEAEGPILQVDQAEEGLVRPLKDPGLVGSEGRLPLPVD